MASRCDAAVRVTAANGTAGRVRALALDLGGRFVVAVAESRRGSAAGGPADAAQAVLDAVQAAVRKAKFDPTSTAAWSALLTDVDDDLWRRDHASATSAVALYTDGDVIIGASVGDCRASVTGRGAWMELTRRQKDEPRLGSGGAEPVAFEVQLKAAELSLVAATGALWKHTPPDQLDGALARRGSIEDSADALVEAAGLAGDTSSDDLAVAVLRLTRR